MNSELLQPLFDMKSVHGAAEVNSNMQPVDSTGAVKDNVYILGDAAAPKLSNGAMRLESVHCLYPV